MTIQKTGKYVKLDADLEGYNFIKDDKELQEWWGDGSIQAGDIIVEVKSIHHVIETRKLEFIEGEKNE